MTDAVQISVITSAAAVVMAGVSAFFAYKAKLVSEETHLAVNSRMTELLEITRQLAAAEATADERARAEGVAAAVIEATQ